MLALKLILVPSFLLFVSLAARRWGAQVGGLLAGLPVSAGPILFVLYLENGAAFTAQVAITGLSAVSAAIAFCLGYAHACQRRGWGFSLGAGILAWLLAAGVLSALPVRIDLSAAITLSSLWVAPFLFPRAVLPGRVGTGGARHELGLRMFAGAALTLAVSYSANALGPQLTGLLSVFPVIATVLACFSQRSQGAAYAQLLLRSMARGLQSLAVFCLSLALALPRMPGVLAFLLAAALSISVQALLRTRAARP